MEEGGGGRGNGGGFHGNARHLTCVPPLRLKSEIGKRRLVLRMERLGKDEDKTGGRRGRGRGRADRDKARGRGGGVS